MPRKPRLILPGISPAGDSTQRGSRILVSAETNDAKGDENRSQGPSGPAEKGASASLAVQEPLEDYPRGWARFDYHVPSADPAWMGFAAGLGEINRFAARYRVARSFRSVELDAYSAETSAGYSALFRVFLAWSAFERLMEIIGVKQRHLAGLLTPYGPERVVRSVRRIDKDRRFYRFIYQRVDAAHRRELDNYFRDDPCNATYLGNL